MLQLYLTPGLRSVSIAVRAVGTGMRVGGMGMPDSKGLQDSTYLVISPLAVAGSCHEKLRLFVVTAVIRNIRGGVGAVEEERNTYQFTHTMAITYIACSLPYLSQYS